MKKRSVPPKVSLVTDQHRQSDERYSIHMNGGSGASPWQSSNAGKMFTVPTQLREYNEIIVKGNMDNGLIDIALKPDGNTNNIVCQLNAVYPENGESHDQILLRNVLNGNDTTYLEKPATYYLNNSYFEIRFTIMPEAISVRVSDSFLGSTPLQHSMDDIKYISVIGEVTELVFAFNKS